MYAWVTGRKTQPHIQITVDQENKNKNKLYNNNNTFNKDK
jgi:hypothetical protein